MYCNNKLRNGALGCNHRHLLPTTPRHMVFYCQAMSQVAARQILSCCPQACQKRESGDSTRQQWLRVTEEQLGTAHAVDFGLWLWNQCLTYVGPANNIVPGFRGQPALTLRLQRLCRYEICVNWVTVYHYCTFFKIRTTWTTPSLQPLKDLCTQTLWSVVRSL